MNGRFNFSVNDVHQAMLNTQRTLSGTAINVLEGDKFTYFITDIIGTNVSLKDKNDNVLHLFPSPIALHHPIRIDGGFKVTASATAYVTFATLNGVI